MKCCTKSAQKSKCLQGVPYSEKIDRKLIYFRIVARKYSFKAARSHSNEPLQFLKQNNIHCQHVASGTRCRLYMNMFNVMIDVHVSMSHNLSSPLLLYECGIIGEMRDICKTKLKIF